MSATPPPSLDPVPTPAIQRNDRNTFSTRLDAFILWLVNAVTQFAALATNVYNNAVDAYTNAGIAAAGAAAAVSASSVIPWVSGTTYTASTSVVSSLINFKTYRRRTNGAGTADPVNDPPNWQLISSGSFPRLHIQEQRPSGSTSSTSLTANTWSQRVFNTQLFNNIVGASLSSNTVTLPAGTYQCDISAGVQNPNAHRIRLYDVTNSINLLLGSSENLPSGTSASGRSFLKGRFTLTAATILRVDHWAQASTYGGAPVTTGLVEVYGDAVFDQVEN